MLRGTTANRTDAALALGNSRFSEAVKRLRCRVIRDGVPRVLRRKHDPYEPKGNYLHLRNPVFESPVRKTQGHLAGSVSKTLRLLTWVS